MKAVVLLSGGMDSATLLAHVVEVETIDAIAVSVNYGQRHVKEIDAAERIAVHYGVEHVPIDLSSLREHLSGSSLTSDDIPVPDGHYAEETMRITVVPNRNLIMLSVAAGLAVSRLADLVATAVHAGDHAIYPDCRPEFIRAARSAISLGTLGFGPNDSGIDVYAPFIHKTKANIAAYGARLNVPFAKTWSCYKGLDLHCGTCGTCTERREAFRDAGLEDPTPYQTSAFAELA